jgi:hypothetical protein
MVDVVRNETPVQPRTVKEAVGLLMLQLTDEDKSLIRSMDENGLPARLQFTLGQAIRNDFVLWAENEELLRSCGFEARHADDASSTIMRALRTRPRRSLFQGGNR